MITFLDENNKLQLTEKALMIDAFAKVYRKFPDKELAMAHFSVMYFMYNFDSIFLRDYEVEKERIAAVKKFIDRGSEVAIDRTMRKALDVYREIYFDDTTSMYLVMRRNVDKLKDYADKMVLISPLATIDPDSEFVPLPGIDFILVESKEFTTINSILPKQQEELVKFETRLVSNTKTKIDIYGGGTKGAYE